MITVLTVDSDLVLKIKWRLNEIFRVLRKLIKIRRLFRVVTVNKYSNLQLILRV